ncbi:MAG: B12-binding domain-containing radical SAM protein, partial [Acidimicrobiales bacterium]|nr:B12-binding domain-containing radical SAM protein [Acidimicrobiales bacterium]
MSSLWLELERVLGEVQKPARYIGCEDGMTVPIHHPDRVAWLLVYPDTYEVGLPNQGLQILYEILNERPDAVAERSYAPWTDMAAVLRREGLPLFSVDTHRPAPDFDVLAFNLSAELVYTNVLECLDLAGIPLRTSDRDAGHPQVLVGGHCSYNPEPLADFIDAAVLGDGEEVVAEITETVTAWRAKGHGSRSGLLRRLATVPGVYVPSLYRAEFDEGILTSITPLDDAPPVVEKRTVADLADWPYPKRQ